MKTFQYNIMKVRDENGNYIEFPSIAQKDPIILKANLTTTAAGYALDANQGYALDLKKFDKTGGVLSGNITVVTESAPAMALQENTTGLQGGIAIDENLIEIFAHDSTSSKNISLCLNPNAANIDDSLLLNINTTAYNVLHSGNRNNYIYSYHSGCTRDAASLTDTQYGFGNIGNTAATENTIYGGYPIIFSYADAEHTNTTYYRGAWTSGLIVYGRNATTLSDGTAVSGMVTLQIGNKTVSTSAKGYSGMIRFYNNTYYSDIYTRELTANRSIYLPTSTSSGTIYLAGVRSSSSAGSATRPVYIATNGEIKACNLAISYSSSEPTSPHTGMIWLKPVS